MVPQVSSNRFEIPSRVNVYIMDQMLVRLDFNKLVKVFTFSYATISIAFAGRIRT